MLAVVVALAVAAGIPAFLVLRPGVVAQRPPSVVQPTEIKIAPEISGRLLRYAVAPGQSVRKGETLAELSNPEFEAGLVLAEAQLGQARAASDRVYAGPREEQVDALAQDIDMANANLVYAQQQFGRTSQLTATGFASHQDLDKATSAVETANANLSCEGAIAARSSWADARGTGDCRRRRRSRRSGCRGGRGARRQIANSRPVRGHGRTARGGAGRGDRPGPAANDVAESR